MMQKIQKRFTGVTAISQHINIIDYIHSSLLIHYTVDNTEMGESVWEVTVAPYSTGIYYCKECYIITFIQL